MRTQILNSLRRGHVVAAEVAATAPDHRAWIGVYPLGSSGDGTRYRIRKFEVSVQYLVDDNDVWEETMVNKVDHYVDSEGELLEILGQYVQNTECFGYPWKCDYPV